MSATLSSLRTFLVTRYEDLKSQLTRRLGSADLASDALQETWLHLHGKEAAEVDIGTVHSPAAYLLRVASNLAVSQYRSTDRYIPVAEVDSILTDVLDTVPGPAHIVEARATAQEVAGIIGHMPERRRRILLAVRLEGIPQKEIAASMGISLRLVELELQKAHEQLAAYVKKVTTCGFRHLLPSFRNDFCADGAHERSGLIEQNLFDHAAFFWQADFRPHTDRTPSSRMGSTSSVGSGHSG